MGRKRDVVKDVHSQSLGEQIENPESNGIRTKPRPNKKQKQADDAVEEDAEMGSQQVSNILALAREQQQQAEQEEAQKAIGGSGAGAPLPASTGARLNTQHMLLVFFADSNGSMHAARSRRRRTVHACECPVYLWEALTSNWSLGVLCRRRQLSPLVAGGTSPALKEPPGRCFHMRV